MGDITCVLFTFMFRYPKKVIKLNEIQTKNMLKEH